MADSLKDLLLLLYKILFPIGVIGIGMFGLGFRIIQPFSEERSWSVTQIVLGGIVGLTIGAIVTTLDYSWLEVDDFRNGDIFIEYDITVSIGMLLLVCLIAFTSLNHINSLREIQKQDPTPTQFSTRWLPLAFVALVISVILLFFQRLPGFQELQLALTFIIPAAITGFAFTMAFRKYPSLLAITSARLEALNIVNPEGLTLYAYDFRIKQASLDDLSVLLGGMLAGLNISLSETLESQEGLSSIGFGDKLIAINRTPKFVTYLTTSEMNPIISDLIKIIVLRFEEQFGEVIDRSHVVDQNQFVGFTETVEDLIQFAPLTN